MWRIWESPLFSYFNNFLVQLLQIFFRRDGSILIFIQQEFIVSQRLHFQIIIEFRQTDQFFIAVSVQNGTEKFTHDTGGTIHQSVPEFLKERTGQKRTLAVVFQMGQRHKTVQIAEPRDIFASRIIWLYCCRSLSISSGTSSIR